MPNNGMPSVADIVAGGPTVEEQLAAAQEAEQQVAQPTEQVVTPTTPEAETVRKPIQERLGDLAEDEIDELFRVSGVAERLERIAMQRALEAEEKAKNQVRQEEAERQSQARREYLNHLRKTDIVKYNEEMDREEELERARQEDNKRWRAVTDEFTRRLGRYVDTNVPKPIADKLRSKDYSEGGRTDLIDGVIKYIDDIINERTTIVERNVEKKIEPVVRKKVLTELNANTGTPQPTGVAAVNPTTTGKTSVLDFQTESEMAEAFANNDISMEDMLEWYRVKGTPSGVRGLF